MDEVLKGGDAASTEMGQVVQKLIDSFEQMDLPASLAGMKIIIVAEGEKEGVCAGSETYGDNAKAVAADLMQHASFLLSTVGIGMDVMGKDELDAMMNAKASD